MKKRTSSWLQPLGSEPEGFLRTRTPADGKTDEIPFLCGGCPHTSVDSRSLDIVSKLLRANRFL